MTEQTTTVTAGIPEWDLADRMRKSLRASGIGVQEIAEYLGVARNTVSTWINGKIEPNVQTQRLWALKCGVSYEWLRTGAVTQNEPPRGGERAVGGGSLFVAPAEGLEPSTCRLTTDERDADRERLPQAA